MSVLAIVRPLPIAAFAGTFNNVARLASPDPKEAAINATGGTTTIDIDLGSAQNIDTLFLGYTNDPGSGGVVVTYGTSAYDDFAWGTVAVAASDLFAPRRHFLSVLGAPVSARYVRVSATFGPGYTIGVARVGIAMRPTWGQELGSGRPIFDTGNVERLFGGGFGINPGVITSGWQWTLGDLQPAELTALFAIAMERGQTWSILVVEDPDQTSGLNERIHWGLFQKLEAYERIAPQDTKWSFTIGDWA